MSCFSNFSNSLNRIFDRFLNWLNWFFNCLVRRKPIEENAGSNSQLKRCLTTFDLTALGVGSTLGLGVYVIAGNVAATKAGPAVVLSFFIAGIASLFAGLCYAEFGARVPKAGSAYVYSYTTVGEFMAFVIGWNLVLEYVIGTASVARGFSGYVDALVNNAMKDHFRAWLPMDIPNMSAYPDIFSFALTVLLTVMLAFGVKESTTFNTVFTGVNLFVVAYVLICGAFRLNLRNWNLPANEIPWYKKDAGSGGFFPNGFQGMMRGAATCFYAFVGFDAIASTGEEAKDPAKAIPKSIAASLFFVMFAYIGVAAVTTLIVPYYNLDGNAPLSDAFQMIGWNVARWIIAIGALTSLAASLLGAMFPLPRVLYAMGSDKVLFRFMSWVNRRTQTPILATIVSGIFAGIISSLFNVEELADMMSIGTLLAYTLVALSVLILRFQEDHKQVGGSIIHQSSSIDSGDNDIILGEREDTVWMKMRKSIREKKPTSFTSILSNCLISVICVVLLALTAVLTFRESDIFAGEPLPIAFSGVLLFIAAVLTTFLCLQPKTSNRVYFQVPFIPFIPLFSAFANFYLMMRLSNMTWIRFIVWLAIGLSIYFGYGICHSIGYMTEEQKRAGGHTIESFGRVEEECANTSDRKRDLEGNGSHHSENKPNMERTLVD